MNANQNIFRDQENIFIHLKLVDDLAYKYSVENRDAFNMQIVLRAHGFDFTYELAEKQIEVALELAA